MPKPLVVTYPKDTPAGRDYWIMDPEAGPELMSTAIGMYFYGVSRHTLNVMMNKIADEYEVSMVKESRNYLVRKYRLYDVERMSHIFLKRGLINYQKFHNAMNVLKAVGNNYKLL
jgi:hypothetical protein